MRVLQIFSEVYSSFFQNEIKGAQLIRGILPTLAEYSVCEESGKLRLLVRKAEVIPSYWINKRISGTATAWFIIGECFQHM